MASAMNAAPASWRVRTNSRPASRKPSMRSTTSPPGWPVTGRTPAARRRSPMRRPTVAMPRGYASVGGPGAGSGPARLRDAHRSHELEVVVVRIGERRDPALVLSGVIRLTDDACSSLAQPLELALHVLRFEVPDDAARLAVLSLDLIVRPERDPALLELPAEVAAVFPGRLAEQLRVIRLEALRILGADQYATELHFTPLSHRAYDSPHNQLHARSRPRGRGHESGQGLFPERRDHEGRPGPVLTRRRALPPQSRAAPAAAD